MSRVIPFHKPLIGDEEIEAVTETLRSGWLTTGSRAKCFEEAFRDVVGARHAIAVSSGTAALHLALDALGVGAGDEVIVPTMTFGATAAVVGYCGARAVLADCEETTLNISVESVKRALSDRTRAMIPVHFAGQVCDMESLEALSRRHGVRIVEDAAHAFPSRCNGRMVGSIGDISCFSFYATKTITTGEGGMLTTDNDEYADRARTMSLHGISRDAWKRYSADGSWYYEIMQPGFKYNLSDIAASIGIEQLKKAESLRQAREDLAMRYLEAFENLPEIAPLRVGSPRDHSWHLFVVVLDVARLRVNRGEFVRMLKDKGVMTSVHFIPLHLHPYYRDKYGYRPGDFPAATKMYERIVSLPIYPGMTPDDADYVAEMVRGIVESNRR